MNILFFCIKVFLARIFDVCLGAFRTVNIVKGNHVVAATIAFFEVLIWYAIAREVLNPDIISIFIPIAYAGGYSVGTYLGTFLSGKLSKGYLSAYIISTVIKKKDLKKIKKSGFGVTIINETDNKLILLIQIDKNNIESLKESIEELDPDAFMIFNETKYLNNGFIK